MLKVCQEGLVWLDHIPESWLNCWAMGTDDHPRISIEIKTTDCLPNVPPKERRTCTSIETVNQQKSAVVNISLKLFGMELLNWKENIHQNRKYVGFNIVHKRWHDWSASTQWWLTRFTLKQFETIARGVAKSGENAVYSKFACVFVYSNDKIGSNYSIQFRIQDTFQLFWSSVEQNRLLFFVFIYYFYLFLIDVQPCIWCNWNWVTVHVEMKQTFICGSNLSNLFHQLNVEKPNAVRIGVENRSFMIKSIGPGFVEMSTIMISLL